MHYYYRLGKLQDDGIANVDKLPYSIRSLEALLRNTDEYVIAKRRQAACQLESTHEKTKKEIAFMPGRVILQLISAASHPLLIWLHCVQRWHVWV